MNRARLVAMANDIAANLCALPQAEALEAMVTHLQPSGSRACGWR